MTHPNGREIYFSGKQWWDHTKQLWIQMSYERWDGREGALVRPPRELILRYTMPQDLEALLYYNGFKVITSYIDHDEGNPATADELPGVYICGKR